MMFFRVSMFFLLMGFATQMQAKSTLTGELHSLYEFRGLSRSSLDDNIQSAPSVRAGGNYDSDTGIYVGGYLSSVAIGLERRFFLGYEKSFEDWSFAVGGQHFSYTSSRFDNPSVEFNLKTGFSFFNLNIDLGQKERARNNDTAEYRHISFGAKVLMFKLDVGYNDTNATIDTDNQYLRIGYDYDVFGAAIATISYVYNETEGVAGADQLLLLKVSRTIDFEFIFEQ